MKTLCFILGIVLLVLLVVSLVGRFCPIYCTVMGVLIPAAHKVLFNITEKAGISFPDEFIWVLFGLFGGGLFFLFLAFNEDSILLHVIGCTCVSTGLVYVAGIMTQLLPEFLVVMLAETVIGAVAWLFIPLFLIILGFGWIFGLFM